MSQNAVLNSTKGAAISAAFTTATAAHHAAAHSFAATYTWSAKNFAAYGLRGTWGSTR